MSGSTPRLASPHRLCMSRPCAGRLQARLHLASHQVLRLDVRADQGGGRSPHPLLHELQAAGAT
eukprot:1242838-Pleurochrysis_carterae.AAC.3